ncbi:tryptophan synthase beta subunit-like PLP-dependent enzyme [Xylariales sp. PMI_506]|nr:tryptophan synthase beta subunit-like PLP-dependent enzyme [Xylariales sp. PMI_506]
MGSYTPDREPLKLWIETPLIPSIPMSRAAGCNILLKLENLQPSGSFKSRGVGNMMLRSIQEHPTGDAHFYCSSGGNAGLACATAAVTLAKPCTIVVPVTTSEYVIAKLRLLGAHVEQFGEHWHAADTYMRTELLARDPAGVYVPPFDHPYLWEGHSSIVAELVPQLRAASVEPDAIICNCGGGGLLNGVMEGVERATSGSGAWKTKPRVLAVETVGADSLNASVRAGELVTLPGITSIATTLGATTVSRRTWEWTREKHLTSLVVTDAEAIMGCGRFLDDARILVEPSCGATVATVYNGDLRRTLGEGLTDEEWSKKNVVIVVCGGSSISLEILKAYQQQFGICS